MAGKKKKKIVYRAIDPNKIKLGKWIVQITANELKKIGRVIYIHPTLRWYTLEFTGVCGNYRESFAMIGE